MSARVCQRGRVFWSVHQPPENSLDQGCSSCVRVYLEVEPASKIVKLIEHLPESVKQIDWFH